MKSVEFIGPPGSGKSFYKRKISNFFKKNEFDILDSSSIFYEEYRFLYKTSFFESFFLKIKKKVTKKKNYFFRVLNFYFDKIYNFESKYNYFNKKRILKRFTDDYFKIFDKFEKKDYLKRKLRKWLYQELPSIYLSKKINSKSIIFINSEGINQRVLRLILNHKKKANSILRNLNYNFFESDILIFLDTKPSICIRRLKKRSQKRYTKSEIKNFYKKSKILFKRSKKIKFKIDANTNSDKLFMKILKILAKNRK